MVEPQVCAHRSRLRARARATGVPARAGDMGRTHLRRLLLLVRLDVVPQRELLGPPNVRRPARVLDRVDLPVALQLHHRRVSIRRSVRACREHGHSFALRSQLPALCHADVRQAQPAVGVDAARPACRRDGTHSLRAHQVRAHAATQIEIRTEQACCATTGDTTKERGRVCMRSTFNLCFHLNTISRHDRACRLCSILDSCMHLYVMTRTLTYILA